MISWFSPCAWSSLFWWPGESKAMVKPVLIANSPSLLLFSCFNSRFRVTHRLWSARLWSQSSQTPHHVLRKLFGCQPNVSLYLIRTTSVDCIFALSSQTRKKGSEQIRNTLVDGSPVSFVEAAAMCIRQHNLWHFNNFKHFYISFSHNEQLKFFISELSQVNIRAASFTHASQL